MSKTPAWLTYLFGWITGLIFLGVEKEDENIRWHAANSLGISLAVTLAFVILRILLYIPIIRWIAIVVQIVVGIGAFVVWIMCMVNAGNGSKFKLPYVTEFAEKNFLNLFK